MELTPFEEEELMKKWQEILGPSNEVVVSFFIKVIFFFMCQIKLTRTLFLSNFFILVKLEIGFLKQK